MGYLEENNRTAEIDEFKSNINNVMKELMGRFKDLQFFTGESMDPDAMIAMCEYKDVNGEERPVLISSNMDLKRRSAKKCFKNSFYTASCIKLIYFIQKSSVFCYRVLFHVKMSNKNEPMFLSLIL